MKYGVRTTIISGGPTSGDLNLRNGLRVMRIKKPYLYPFHIDLWRYKILVKIMENERPDLIHLHHPNIKIVDKQIPHIVTMHSVLYYDVLRSPIVDLHSFLTRLNGTMTLGREKRVIEDCKVVTAVSQSVADDIVNISKNRSETLDVKIVGNGVDVDRFCPRENGHGSRIILYVGRVDPSKGILDLLKTAKHVIKSEKRAKFILVGSGRTEFINRIKRKVRTLKMERNFLLKGYVRDEVLPKFYGSATLFILPSYREGLCTSLLEAMACGLPVIATNIPNNREIIMNGKNGLLVPLGNPSKMAEQILHLLHDVNLQKEVGRRARETILRRFTWDKIAKEFLGYYERALDGSIDRDLI